MKGGIGVTPIKIRGGDRLRITFMSGNSYEGTVTERENNGFWFYFDSAPEEPDYIVFDELDAAEIL